MGNRTFLNSRLNVFLLSIALLTARTPLSVLFDVEIPADPTRVVAVPDFAPIVSVARTWSIHDTPKPEQFFIPAPVNSHDQFSSVAFRPRSGFDLPRCLASGS